MLPFTTRSSHRSPFPVLGYLRGEDVDSCASPIAEQSYVFLGARDVIIKPCASAVPKTLEDFCGHTRLELTRMTEEQARARMRRTPAQGIESLLGDFVRKENGYRDCAVRVCGKLHTRGSLNSAIRAIVLVASTPARRNFILQYLQYVVSPESVMHGEVLRDAQVATAARFAPSHAGLPIVGERAHNALDQAIRASSLANWGGATVFGISGAMDVNDKLAAGITLVGPAIQVVSLGLRFGTMFIARREGEGKCLLLACQVLCRMARDVTDALFSVAGIVEGEDILSGMMYEDLFEKILNVMAEIWSSRTQVERQILLNSKDKFKTGPFVSILDGLQRVNGKMLPINIAICQSQDQAMSDMAISELRNDSKIVAEALSSAVANRTQ